MFRENIEMTSTEIKTELKRLEKIGIPEDMAMLIAAAKYNKPELADEVIEGALDEQQQIINEMSEMRPLEVVDTTGIITPILPENIFFVVDDIYRVNKPFQIEGTFDLSLNVADDEKIKITYEEISEDNVNDSNEIPSV